MITLLICEHKISCKNSLKPLIRQGFFYALQFETKRL